MGRSDARFFRFAHIYMPVFDKHDNYASYVLPAQG